MIFQKIVRAFYPPQCGLCEAPTETEHALCGSCWADMYFLGRGCQKCGAPLLGLTDGTDAICDDCTRIARPWLRGGALLAYKDGGRRFVLALKHGDRTDLALTAGPWMARAISKLNLHDPVIVPVPLHRSRLRHRRYNQAALLAVATARHSRSDVCLDALRRAKRTLPLDGATRDQRFERLSGAIEVNRKRAARIAGRDIVILDDVMTSGATFSASAEACQRAGAEKVCVLSLARAIREV